MCAWMETSRADTGPSQIITSGSTVSVRPMRFWRGHLVDLAEPGIEAVPHPVTQEVARHDNGGQCQARELRDMRGVSQVVTARRDHATKRRAGRRNTGSEKAQRSLCQDQAAR